jgi:hypothetical protein
MYLGFKYTSPIGWFSRSGLGKSVFAGKERTFLFITFLSTIKSSRQRFSLPRIFSIFSAIGTRSFSYVESLLDEVEQITGIYLLTEFFLDLFGYSSSIRFSS